MFFYCFKNDNGHRCAVPCPSSILTSEADGKLRVWETGPEAGRWAPDGEVKLRDEFGALQFVLGED